MDLSAFDPKVFLRENNLSEERFGETKLEWTVLKEICARQMEASESLSTAASYISSRLQSVRAVHSLNVRIKDPGHLIAKIIRKKLERPEADFQITNYENLITDLIGIRALHLFKQDWCEIHEFITNTWELYETPIAYIRDGDPREISKAFSEAGCEVRDHPFGYRSLHYVVKSQPDKTLRLAEIQVRTIFEEGWSEIDHRVRYPRHSSDQFLAQFLTIFNRLAGSADEMGTFIKALSLHLGGMANELAATQEQYAQKEKELEGAIERLEIKEKEKTSLKKQIKEMQNPSEASFKLDASVLANLSYASLALLGTPSTISISACRVCSRTYSPSSDDGVCPLCKPLIGGTRIFGKT